jgi:hypothetical protein
MNKLIPFSFTLLLCAPVPAQTIRAYLENVPRELVDIEVLMPAERAYDTAVHTILVDPGPFLNPEVKLSIEDKSYQVGPSSLDLPRICADALAGRIADGPRFIVKTGGTLTHHADSSKLTWDEIDSICYNEGVDGLLLLEKMQVSLSTTYLNNTQDEEKAYFRKWVAVDNMIIHVGWSFYIPANRLSIRKDTTIAEDITSNEFANTDEALANLPAYADLFKDYAFYAGDISASAFSPIWKTEQRNYFLTGNSEMNSVEQLIADGKWDEVFAIWRKYANYPNTVLSAHASYNTILSYEIEGDLETALTWANRTFNTYEMPDALEYAELLAIRIKAKEIIEKQLGITK